MVLLKPFIIRREIKYGNWNIKSEIKKSNNIFWKV